MLYGIRRLFVCWKWQKQMNKTIWIFFSACVGKLLTQLHEKHECTRIKMNSNTDSGFLPYMNFAPAFVVLCVKFSINIILADFWSYKNIFWVWKRTFLFLGELLDKINRLVSKIFDPNSGTLKITDKNNTFRCSY